MTSKQHVGEFGVLLALLAGLVLAFLLPPFLTYGEFVLRTLVVVSLASSAFLVRQNRVIFGVLLAAGAVILVSVMAPMAEKTQEVLYFSASAVFLLSVNMVFTVRIFAARTVDTALLLIAICVYLGFAAFAAMLFGLLETFVPGSFHFPEAGQQGSVEGVFMYFSIVTISTLGYGDVFPLTTQARTIASFEAVAGQIYLTFVVARLVGLHISSSGSGSES